MTVKMKLVHRCELTASCGRQTDYLQIQPMSPTEPNKGTILAHLDERGLQGAEQAVPTPLLGSTHLSRHDPLGAYVHTHRGLSSTSSSPGGSTPTSAVAQLSSSLPFHLTGSLKEEGQEGEAVAPQQARGHCALRPWVGNGPGKVPIIRQ